MLVYGKEERFPISFGFPSLELAHQLELIENDVMSIRIIELMKLEEKRNPTMLTLEEHQ